MNDQEIIKILEDLTNKTYDFEEMCSDVGCVISPKNYKIDFVVETHHEIDAYFDGGRVDVIVSTLIDGVKRYYKIEGYSSSYDFEFDPCGSWKRTYKKVETKTIEVITWA